MLQPHHVCAILLAGGGKAFLPLPAQPGLPAVPVAAPLCPVDFSLANLFYSGLPHVAVLTQPPGPDDDHITHKLAAWQTHLPGLLHWVPSLQRTGSELYLGTADAVHQNHAPLTAGGFDALLILAGDQIYQQDYRDLLRFHHEKEADLTICVTTVAPQQSHRYGMLTMNADQRITSFVEKPTQPIGSHASMGIYVFKTAFLLNLLAADARDPHSGHDFGRDIIPPLVHNQRVFAYHFNGAWADVRGLLEK